MFEAPIESDVPLSEIIGIVPSPLVWFLEMVLVVFAPLLNCSLFSIAFGRRPPKVFLDMNFRGGFENYPFAFIEELPAVEGK